MLWPSTWRELLGCAGYAVAFLVALVALYRATFR